MNSKRPSSFEAAIKPRKQWLPEGGLSIEGHVNTAIIEPYYAELKIDEYKNIQFGAVDDTTFNAFASLPSVIGVNLGAFATLAAMFRHMLARPNILTHVGDPKSEECDLPKISRLDYCSNIIPKDPVRRLYAAYLNNMALDFLMRHELAHIRNGHLDFLNAEVGLSEYAEMSNDIPDGLSLLDIQSLEMDADCYAAAESFRWHISQSTKLQCTLTGTNIAIQPGSPETMYWFCFTTYAFFSAFYQEQIDSSQLNELTHPPANMRQIQATATVFENLRTNFRETFKEAASRAAADCRHAFAAIHSMPVDNESIILATSDEYKKHSASLLDNWKLLRPKLEKHVRAGILAH